MAAGNIYSAEYAHSKGAAAEELRNSEMSCPIMVSIIFEKGDLDAVAKRALKARSGTNIKESLNFLQNPAVRETWLQALGEATIVSAENLVPLWDRQQTISNSSSMSTSKSREQATSEEMDSSRNQPVTKVAKCTTTDIPAEDLAYWKCRCIPMVESLLQSCEAYSITDQAAQLKFLQENVVPNLGPRPTGPESQIISMATFRGFPLQPSINISSSGSTKLRYTFEPLDGHSGSPKDPFALVPAQKVLFQIANQLGVWKGWIEDLVAAYHPTAQEVENTRPKIRQYLKNVLKRTNGQSDLVDFPEMTRMWVCFIAFDLDGATQAMKAYFDPKVKEAATGIPSCRYCYQVIRSLQRFGNYTAVDMLEG